MSRLRIRCDVSWTRRLRHTSDSDDGNVAARSPDEPFYVVCVACKNRGFLPKGCRHHNGVNDIRRFGHVETGCASPAIKAGLMCAADYGSIRSEVVYDA